MARTPEPPLSSLADSITVTSPLKTPLEHAAPLQEMLVAGPTVSIWIGWALTDSTLPALSTEKNLTVLLLDIVNAPT